MQNAVVHAAWGKHFSMETKGGSLSCLEACPVVRSLLRNLEEWEQGPLGAVLLEARAMPIVRASPLLSMLCRRLEVVFGGMTKYWRSYVSPWLPGRRLDPESNPDILHSLSNTPGASFFEESFFGIYKDCMRLMGVTAAPWQVRATALFRANHSVDTTMLDEDVPRVPRLTREVAEGVGTVREFRCQLAARRRLQAEREQAERERKQRERAEKIRQQREEAEQREREREEKRAQREREKVERKRAKLRKAASKRVRHEICSEGLVCNEPSKRARVASVVPKDPGLVSTGPPEESWRSSRVRKAPAHLADFVQ